MDIKTVYQTVWNKSKLGDRYEIGFQKHRKVDR